MSKKPPKFRDALAVLCRHQVDFIVVGGVAAVLNGAPISTFDLDLVHSRSPDNLAKLASALVELDAHYRDQTGRRLPPDSALLAGPGHNLFHTKFGPVDLLGTIGDGHDYDELVHETTERPLEGTAIRVLDLATLIRIKEETAHDKDRATLAILRRTLEQANKKA